jgi:hypothetical protein
MEAIGADGPGNLDVSRIGTGEVTKGFVGFPTTAFVILK